MNEKIKKRAKKIFYTHLILFLFLFTSYKNVNISIHNNSYMSQKLEKIKGVQICNHFVILIAFIMLY